jgi:hypothetical protein
LYADDTQLYITFDILGDPSTAIQRLEECIAHVKAWIEQNMLKLNDSKTEVIIFKPPRFHVDIPSVCVGVSNIMPTPVVRNLGSWFDQHMNMQDHIKKICSSAYFHLRNIAAIRNALTEDATTQLIPDSLHHA